MTNSDHLLDHLNPAEVTPSGWINTFGLLAWCAVGGFFLSQAVTGTVASAFVGVAGFVVLALFLAFAIQQSNA